MAGVHRVWLVAVAIICVWGVPHGISQGEEKLDIIHGPYLQAVTESSATVVWFTNKNCVSRVEYAPCASNEFRTVVASHHGLIDANARIHKITLAGLQPGISYNYRVTSREIVKFEPYEVVYGDTIAEGPYRVQTWNPRKDKFSFCVVNDIHGKADRLESLLDLIPLATMDMVFLNGDMIDHWSRENQVFDGFLDVCVKRFAREMPPVYIRGNHETRGALARGLLDYFPTPNGQYYHAFHHGPVSILVLDSGEDKPDSNKEYSGLVDFDAYMAEQTKWLRETVRDESFRRSRYRIAFTHMPPFANGRAYGITRIRELWSPILNEANIDLAFSGHTHRFARIDPNESANHYPIIVNAPDMVVHVDVSESRLDVTIAKVDGQVVDKIALKPRLTH